MHNHIKTRITQLGLNLVIVPPPIFCYNYYAFNMSLPPDNFSLSSSCVVTHCLWSSAPEEITIIEVVKTSVEEVEDEVVPDSEYELKTPSKDDSTKTESKPTEEPPPPVRDRTLGGIDYYKLSYDDPIFDNGYY